MHHAPCARPTAPTEWEDPKNEHGGCWTASINKGGNGKAQLDAWWLNGVLACIGEQFSDGDEICGLAVNIRPSE
jgi:translation initiation factor 4E